MKKIDILENIHEEYELLSKIKTNGNSELFLVYDKICGRKVLMKSGKAEMIENESRALSALCGKGIPTVYGCFVQDDTAYLFRQYIEGQTLREHLDINGVFTVKKAIGIGIEICEIISRCHNADPPVIHRDIKPENIILAADGEVYIIDFGISREYSSSAERDTQVMGTLSSAPPEQFGYGQTDERSDIYSLGVLLREITNTDMKNPVGKFSKIIKKCTMFSPDDRYKNVLEVKSDLIKAAGKRIPKKLFAAFTAVLLCTASVLAATSYMSRTYRNETFYYVPIDKLYLRDYVLSNRIPKSVLERYNGDIRITLEIEIVEPQKNWANFAVIAFTDDSSDPRPLKAEISCEYFINENGFIEIGIDRTECELVLSRDVVEELSEKGICFQPANVQIKSALLSEVK